MSTKNPFRRISEKNSPALSQSARRAPAPKADDRKRMAVRKLGKFASKRDEALFDQNGEFNPQRFERGAVKEAASTGFNRRMFDNKGHISANDKKDALTQAMHLLNNVTRRNADRLSFYDKQEQEGGMSKEARRQVLAAALSDPSGEGFRIVGQELALPIKSILDYEGFARKLFRVRNLAQGELFRIPLDVRATAWVIGQDGQTPRSVIKTKWIMPDETKITSFPVIDISDIYQMNFDVLDRAQDTARQEIELNEDKRAIAVLDAASTTENAATTFATLGIAAFEDIRFQVERHRLIVERFYINRAEVSDIVKTMSTAVDPVTERELILAGYIGNVLNASIMTVAGLNQQEVIPAGTVYATTHPDYLGEMGVRFDLSSEPFNEYANQRTTKGWAFLEQVGFAVVNSKSVAKGSK